MIDHLFLCVCDCLFVSVSLCFQVFCNWRHDQTVRFAQQSMEKRQIGCPLTWLLAASNSCPPHLLGFALLIAKLQPQLADQLRGRAGPSNYPHPSSPPLSVSWQRCLHNLYICLQTDPNMDLRVVRTQIQLCGDTTARGTPSAVQVDVPDIVDITAFLLSVISCGPWLSPPPPRC